MAEKRKPGRPPKKIGLAPLEKVDGSTLRDLRHSNANPEGSVLPETREAHSEAARTLGVFRAARGVDGGRAESASQPSAVPDVSGDEAAGVEEPIASIFKRLLQETAAPQFQENGTRWRNAEVLARTILNRALQENQAAIDIVLDRAEGKAVRGTPVAQTDTTIEDQIDRASVEQLNKLVPTPKES